MPRSYESFDDLPAGPAERVKAIASDDVNNPPLVDVFGPASSTATESR